MKRFSSQLIFCSPEKILRRTVIEQDDQNKISHFISLDQSVYEPAQTQFFDGIISSEIVSLKENISIEKLDKTKNEYHYFDLSTELISSEIISDGKPLLFDFGKNNTEIINSKFKLVSTFLNRFTIFEIIAACTSLPAQIAAKNSILKVNNISSLILWSNVDFSTMKLTEKTFIRFLS
ncbi:MAG: hypothetical protein PHS59_04290 [Paludibacter sp.]|nr:hypothetical protein [Paludibacter sp.]